MKKAIPIVVILLGLGAYVYFYRVLPAQTYDPEVRGSGTIEAKEVLISSKMPARILSISVDEGARVENGATLVALDCRDLEVRVAQAETQVAQAEAAVAQTKAARFQTQAAERQAQASLAPIKVNQARVDRDLKRALELIGSEGIPQRLVDDAETAKTVNEVQLTAATEGVKLAGSGVRVAASAVAVAESQIALAKKAVEIGRIQIEECVLKAPMPGVVLLRNYEPGEIVMPGSAILKLGRLDQVHTWIYVPNEEVGRVRIGGRVKLVADTYPGREFTGTVALVNSEAEFTPKSIQTKEDRTRLVFGVKVAIDNRDGALLPGMPVEARVVAP